MFRREFLKRLGLVPTAAVVAKAMPPEAEAPASLPDINTTKWVPDGRMVPFTCDVTYMICGFDGAYIGPITQTVVGTKLEVMDRSSIRA